MEVDGESGEENVRGADGRHTPVGQQHSTKRIYLRRRHHVFVHDQMYEQDQV